jgi:hypothetical protein
MKNRGFAKAFIALYIISILCVPISAYDVNKDLKNIGDSNAYDLKVILAGSETVEDTYDGYTIGGKAGWFGKPNITHNTNTGIHWQDFNDGTNNVIDSGQVIHVGWTTQDHSSNVLDMFWTDASGNRIEGSKIDDITNDWDYDNLTGQFTATWENIFSPGGSPGDTITISDVRWTMFDTRIPLDELNTENTVLAAAFQPLSGGTSFDVDFGDSVSLNIPTAVPDGHSVVLRYESINANSSAEALNFVQTEVPEPGTLILLTLGGLLLRKKT